MSQAALPKVTVGILDEVRLRAQRLSREFGKSPRFETPIEYVTLNDAFVQIESAPPDIVLVSPTLAARSEYPMIEALIDMLGVRRFFLVRRVRKGTSDDKPSPLTTDLEIREFVAALKRFLGVGDHPEAAPNSGDDGRMVVIGSSTGGIEALLSILPHFPKNCPPTLIVQHIKAEFVTGLVQRLDDACAADVRVATDQDVARAGRILVAPGNTEHLVLRANGRRCALVGEPPESGHRPSVNRLFHSAVPYKDKVVAVLLTGMGRDGAAGMHAIRGAGGWTIAQDEASCVVYGMPKAAVAMGGVCEQIPLQKIGPAVLKAARHNLVTSA